MNAFVKKTFTAAAAALTLGVALAASASPAEARWGRNGAFFGGVAAGVVGGAIIANSARPVYAAPVYEGVTCWRERREVYNRYGDFVGYRSIRVCN